jgi:exopolysaccharide biosynthesis polyprenyl glycosylphosphotransferase
MREKKKVGVLLIGGNERVHSVAERMRRAGYPVARVVSPFAEEGYRVIEQGEVDRVVVVMPEGRKLFEVLYSLSRYKVTVEVPVDRRRCLSVVDKKMLRGKFLFDVGKSNLSVTETIIKFLFDKVVSVLAFVVLTPLFLYLAVRIRRDSAGPILFCQERIGRRGRPFMIYKFRTMVTCAEDDGPQLSMENDPRITPFGAFMRKYRLDELPQFWNVLKGDMSLVGPRPERRYFIDQILEHAPYYFLVHNVRPGITSLGMVKYGYAVNVYQMIDRLQYDIVYYNKMSLWLDMKILFLTVKTVVMGRGL